MVDEGTAALDDAAHFAPGVRRQLAQLHRVAFHAAGVMRKVSQPMAALDVPHAAVLFRRIRQGDPAGQRMIRSQIEVGVVLVVRHLRPDAGRLAE